MISFVGAIWCVYNSALHLSLIPTVSFSLRFFFALSDPVWSQAYIAIYYPCQKSCIVGCSYRLWIRFWNPCLSTVWEEWASWKLSQNESKEHFVDIRPANSPFILLYYFCSTVGMMEKKKDKVFSLLSQFSVWIIQQPLSKSYISWKILCEQPFQVTVQDCVFLSWNGG